MSADLTKPPRCPRCGSSDGYLGTSYAYFMCRACNKGQPVYWTADHDHPVNWDIAIAASPWARERRRRELAGEPGEGWTPREGVAG